MCTIHHFHSSAQLAFNHFYLHSHGIHIDLLIKYRHHVESTEQDKTMEKSAQHSEKREKKPSDEIN